MPRPIRIPDRQVGTDSAKCQDAHAVANAGLLLPLRRAQRLGIEGDR